MNLIPDEKINEIRGLANIVDVISSYIPLTSKGKNYFGVCPFHDDHSPSMSVSPDRQMFKCFTCGVGGNVYNFVSRYENISFVEAIKKVADYVGVDLDISKFEKKESIHKHEFEIMEFASKIYQNNLNTSLGAKSREYLKTRNINESIINTFKIGFAIDDNKNLYNILSKKYKNKELEELGLINLNGLDGYDKFVNRIMIPITDINNNVVGFTGRIIDNSTDQAKYINTKETKIYKKGNILFNYFNAKQHIKQSKKVVVVEGNMDAIRLYASGIKNVVALMGTSLTKEQIMLLKNLRVPVVLMLDNDSAGEMATISNGELLQSNNIDTYIVRLSDVKDPDEYIIKYGVDKLNGLINHAVSYMDYKLKSLKKEFNLNNPIELSKYINNIIKYLKDKDNITKEVTIRKISDDYNIDYEILKSELKLEEKNNKNVITNIDYIKKDRYKECTNEIFIYLMSDIKYISIFKNKINFFRDKEERELYNEILYYSKKFKNINIANFISFIEQIDDLKEYVNNIIGKMNFDNISEDIFMEYINYLENYFRKENIKKLKEQLKSETDINKKCELINNITKLKKEV